MVETKIFRASIRRVREYLRVEGGTGISMEPSYADLRERVERLERLVEELRAPGRPLTAIEPRQPGLPAVKPRPLATTDLRTWLRYIGIGLLLFGVVFLFKFSDNEPITVRVLRVGIGVALGMGLTAVGRALLSRDRAFAQVLTGGGIGVWYISGFAAYQLFALVPAAPAFAYMTVVTALAFVISVRQNSLPLTIVATVGGLATPSLLYDAERGALGVVAYVALVTTGAVAIHIRRQWTALLWAAAGGSAIALLAVAIQHVSSPDAQRWSIQAGVLYLWVMFGVVAAVSYIRATPTRERAEGDDDRVLLSTVIPVVAVVTTATVWNMENDALGLVCLATALVYAVVTVRLYPVVAWRRLTSAHFFVASGMAAVGASLLADGNAQRLAIATEALVLRLLCRPTNLYIASIVSHGLYGIAAFLLIVDLFGTPRPDLPLFNATGLTMLGSIATLAIAAVCLPRGRARRLYVYATHAMSMAWVLHQFSRLPNGQAIVTVIWGVDGVTLLVVGLRIANRYIRTLGLATLLAVVGKLFLVDLASVPAIWRILLFIGFGGVFLALSYWFISLDRGRAGAKREPG